jgi:5'-deoxynucleotidase YfbR-like HD superfamily hydrolase
MEKNVYSKIDLNYITPIETSEVVAEPASPASIALRLGALAMHFSRVERVPRYDGDSRENDAEHSYMLALVANELALQLYPEELDTGLITQYAIVHDLIETVTGDVATFQLNADELAQKQKNEHDALHALCNSLPPFTARLLKAYEIQSDPEARFVKATDKLLPVIVDILGDGKKVMNEDYGILTTGQLRLCQEKLLARIAQSFEEFPPIVDAYALLSELFQLEFESTTRS